MKLEDIYKIIDKECPVTLIKNILPTYDRLHIEISRDSQIEPYQDCEVYRIEAMQNHEILLYIKEVDR